MTGCGRWSTPGSWTRSAGSTPQGLRRGVTASRALGYAQLLAVLDGEIDLEEAIAATAALTRRFVRRQRSWFRRDERMIDLDASDPDLLEQADAGRASGAGCLLPGHRLSRRSETHSASRPPPPVAVRGLAPTGAPSSRVTAPRTTSCCCPIATARSRSPPPRCGRSATRTPASAPTGSSGSRLPRPGARSRLRHGLPQCRRLAGPDVRQRGSGVRPVSGRQRLGHSGTTRLRHQGRGPHRAGAGRGRCHHRDGSGAPGSGVVRPDRGRRIPWRGRRCRKSAPGLHDRRASSRNST